jgi:hypothetical protein
MAVHPITMAHSQAQEKHESAQSVRLLWCLWQSNSTNDVMCLLHHCSGKEKVSTSQCPHALSSPLPQVCEGKQSTRTQQPATTLGELKLS